MGDITIEDGRIRISSRGSPPASPDETVTGRSAHRGVAGGVNAEGESDTEPRAGGGLQDHLASLDPRKLVGLGMLITLVGTVAYLTGGRFDLIGFLTSGGALIPAGAGLAIMTLHATHLRRRRANAALRALAERHGPAIEAALGRGHESTVEGIAARSGLDVETIVRVLAHLHAEGRILEELHVETGDWIYELAPPPPNTSGSLAERLDRMGDDR